MDGKSKQTARSASWRKNLKNKNRTRSGGPVYMSRFSVKGGPFKIPENPPDVTLQPWLPITLLLDVTNDNTLLVKNLVAAFRSQYDGEGLYLNPKKDRTATTERGLLTELRLISVKGWAIEGKTLTAVVFDPSDARATQKNLSVLKMFFDSGTPSHIPSFGYKYPDAISEKVLVSSDDVDGTISIEEEDGSSQLIKIDVAGSSHVIVYYSVLIKPYGYPRAPSITSISSRILQQTTKTSGTALDIANSMVSNDTGRHVSHLASVADRMADILKELKILSESAEKSKPSTLSRIVDGVKYTALAVATVAGGQLEEDIEDASEASGSGEWIQ